MRITQFLVSLAVLALGSGCILVDDRPYGSSYQRDTSYEVRNEIVFEYNRNVNQTCVARSDSWRVVARELGEEATASCTEAIAFGNLLTGETVTFDIEGYQDGTLCAQGTCLVTAEMGSNLADCERQIQYFCRY